MCGQNFGNFLFPLLTASLLATETPRPQAVTTAQSTCPQCGHGLRTQPCAYCGNTIGIGERSCPSCGAPAGNK
jgi:hypothetical protein